MKVFDYIKKKHEERKLEKEKIQAEIEAKERERQKRREIFPFEVEWDLIRSSLSYLTESQYEKLYDRFDDFEGYSDAIENLYENFGDATYAKRVSAIKRSIKAFRRWVDPVLPYWDEDSYFYERIVGYCDAEFSRKYRELPESDIYKYEYVYYGNICYLYDLLDYYENNADQIKKELKLKNKNKGE